MIIMKIIMILITIGINHNNDNNHMRMRHLHFRDDCQPYQNIDFAILKTPNSTNIETNIETNIDHQTIV